MKTHLAIASGIALTLGVLCSACDDEAPPRRSIAGNPDATEARDADSPDTQVPERVASWLSTHPSCIGDGAPLFRDATVSNGAWHFQARTPSGELYDQMVGGGVAMADLDQDGDLDLYIGVAQGSNAVLLNDGAGRFSRPEVSDVLGAADDWTNGVSAVDFDNDGDQDLFLSNRGSDRLLENRGDLEFVDVTTQTNINSRGNSATATWADFNGDGWLDLVVAKLADAAEGDMVDRSRPPLYLSDGEGRFERLDNTVFPRGSTFILPAVDLDDDGDIDLLHTQEFSHIQRATVIENLGPSQDAPVSWRVHTLEGFEAAAPATMGAALLDIDHNDLPDIYTTNLWGEAYRGEVLARNLGGLTFENVAESADAQPMTDAFDVESVTRAVSWAALAADFRNAGHLDLFVGYGQLVEVLGSRDHVSYPPLFDKQPDALLLRTAPDRFELAAGSCAESVGATRGAAVGDVNADGCLDLVTVPRVGSARLLLNRCEQVGHFLRVRLAGTGSNRDAVGSRVWVTAGGEVQRRWVTVGSTSVFSSSPRTLHFGLGNHETVDTVRVMWPDGDELTVSDVEVDQTLVLTQPR